MNRPFVLAASCAAALSLIAGAAFAQTTSAPKHHARTTTKAAPKGATISADSVETINAAQLEIAGRVLTGTAHCEMNQQVDVHPIDGRPGFFKVGFKNASYTMVPQETTTGAVRLEDKKAGVIWIQIPAKSMLLNSKVGQRMVDSCTQSQQRAGV
ncbi:MAG TPA: hypothetical protein VJ743_23370 [Albitalea sp.]|nr:hypothetical protein [Albitalea sp.]